MFPNLRREEGYHVYYGCEGHQQFPFIQEKNLLAWQGYFGFFSIFFHKGTIPLLTSITMPRDAKHNGTPMINPSAIHTKLVVKTCKADIIEDKNSFFPFSGLISVKYRLIVEYVSS